jgi:hypothetical protein
MRGFFKFIGKKSSEGQEGAKGSRAEGIEKTKGENFGKEVIIPLDRLKMWYDNQLSHS